MANEKLGQELMQKATKMLKSWFKTESTYDEVAELYSKAGAQFKIGKNYELAGNAYRLAGENKERCGNSIEATQMYLESAKAFVNDDSIEEGIKMYKLVIAMQMASNRFSQVAKLYNELGDLYETESKYTDAIEQYMKSADIHHSEQNSRITGNAMYLKVAQLSANISDYKRAILLYEKVAMDSLDSASTKWNVNGYLFNSILCQFLLNSQNVSDKYKEYCDLHPAFLSSQEGKLIDSLIKSCSNHNVQLFTDVLYEYNKVYPLDSFKTGLLLKIKNQLIEMEEMQLVKEKNDDDLPDWS